MQSYSLNSRAAHYDARAPLQFPDGRSLAIVEWCVRHEWNWENKYIVDMELFESTKGHPYAVQVHINWEARYNDERVPSQSAILRLARQLVWEHFDSHRQPPCLSLHRFPIHIEF